jgi:hypothetical protein
MNQTIIEKYRELITEKLSELPKDYQSKFVKMYGNPDSIAICRLDNVLNLIEENIRRNQS